MNKFVIIADLTLIRRYLAVLLVGTSLSAIVFISYDRYILLSKTNNYRKYMGNRKITIIIVVCWIIPALIPFSRKASNEERYYSTILVLLIIIYFIALTLCYVAIVKTVKSKLQALNNNIQAKRKESRIARTHIRAAKVVALIILCFGIAVGPMAFYQAMNMVNAFLSNGIPGFKGETKEVIFAIAMTIIMVNSVINPVIYYLRIPEFKEGFITMSDKNCPVSALLDSAHSGHPSEIRTCIEDTTL